MASNAGNFWENIEVFGLFLYFHSIIFVVNYKMNIISSHKMYIISPSVRRAAVRGWFWVSGCSSDMSRCIHWDWYWYPGDCLRSLGQLRHRFATYYGSQISKTSGSDLGSRVFEAPFATLVLTSHQKWFESICLHLWNINGIIGFLLGPFLQCVTKKLIENSPKLRRRLLFLSVVDFNCKFMKMCFVSMFYRRFNVKM